MFQRIRAESGAIKPQASASRARAPTRTPAVRRLVSGILLGNDTAINSLVTEADTPDASGPSAARVVAKDAKGKTLARAVIHGVPQQEEGQPSATLPFVVALPNKKRIVSLQVLPRHRGKPLARLRASKHAPKGRFLKLPRRARAKRPLTVRWKAGDRDRRDDLSVLLLARRGQSRWRTIVLGPGKGRIRVEPSALGKGKALRLRLRVSDGFNTTATTSRPVALKR